MTPLLLDANQYTCSINAYEIIFLTVYRSLIYWYQLTMFRYAI